MLGLPDHVTTCLFDLDGVLTDTASVHKSAWKAMFDTYLHEHHPEQPDFDIESDYLTYVDGKPREAGVRDFLASRDIHLPDGDRDDAPGTETVWGLGNLKNDEVQKTIKRDGVTVYEGSRRYLEAAEKAGLRRFVVSSSANTKMVLEVTGLDRFIEGRVDGNTLAERGLPGKPAPDCFLAGADLAGVTPGQAAVFEDALSGVEAGRAGDFGYVIGVDRVGQREQLREHGADVVIDDLADLLDDAGDTASDRASKATTQDTTSAENTPAQTEEAR